MRIFEQMKEKTKTKEEKKNEKKKIISRYGPCPWLTLGIAWEL